MKKTIAVTATVLTLSLGMAEGAIAADKAKIGEDQIITSTMGDAATSSAGGWVLPLIMLVMVAASVASD